MSMPTPSNRRLPQPPLAPPRSTQREEPTTPAQQESPTPSDQSSVLDRLKAAHPKAAPASDEERTIPTTTAAANPPIVPPGEPEEPHPSISGGPAARNPEERAEKLIAQRARKLSAASAAASAAAAAWAVKSGKQTASWTASAGRSAASNVRAWPLDNVRRVLVSLVVLGSLGGTALVSGVLDGSGIRDAAVLNPDLTLVSPNPYSLYIWPLIGLGLIGYAVHQWLPGQADSPRHRRVGWALIAALFLTLGLTLAVRAELHVVSLAIHGVLLVVLLVCLYWLNRWSAATRTEGALVDVPLGLFLGWTGFTAFTSTAAVLTLNNVSWLIDDNFAWALIGLVVVVLAGSTICSTDRGRVAVALALVWGFVWVAVERIFGQPDSIPVAAACALAAFLVLITAGSRRHHVDHSYRRALRRRQTANLPPIDLTEDDDLDDEDYEDYDDDPRGRR